MEDLWKDLWTPSRTPTTSFLIPFSHIFWLIYSFFHRFYSHLLFFQRKWREYGCQHKKSPRPFFDTYHWSVWFPFQMNPKKQLSINTNFLVQELFQTFNQAKEISQRWKASLSQLVARRYTNRKQLISRESISGHRVESRATSSHFFHSLVQKPVFWDSAGFGCSLSSFPVSNFLSSQFPQMGPEFLEGGGRQSNHSTHLPPSLHRAVSQQ